MTWQEKAIKAIDLSFNSEQVLDYSKKDNFDFSIKLFKESINLKPDKAWPYLKYADMESNALEKIKLYAESLIVEDNEYAKIHIKSILEKYFFDKDLFSRYLIINNLVILTKSDFIYENIKKVSEEINPWIKNKFKDNNLKILIIGKEQSYRNPPADIYYWNGEEVNYGFNKLQKIKQNKEKDKVLKIGYVGNINNKSNIDKLITSICKINLKSIKYSLHIIFHALKENQNYYEKIDNIYLKKYETNKLVEYYSNLDVCVCLSSDQLYSGSVYESLYMGIPVIVSDISAHKIISDYSLVLNKLNEQSFVSSLNYFYDNYDKFLKRAKKAKQLNFYSWEDGFKEILSKIN